MTKKIQLGNNEAMFVNNDIKQNIINYLFDKLDLTKYRYIMLNTIQKLKFLKENEHYVSPNFKGYNYLLIMITLNNKKYCVFIDRRKLNYNKSQIDIRTLPVLQIFLKTSDDIFKGTIIDGKMIQSDNKYFFLIQDCFYLMGEKITDPIDIKLNRMNEIINLYLNKMCCKNCEFKVNKLYTYDELPELINNIMTNIKLNTNGIVFYPKLSGINVIHVEKKQEKVSISNMETVKQSSYHIIYDFVDFLNNRTYSYEQNSKMKQLFLTKTDIPDVYNVYEKQNTDKIGIALVPNLKTSHMLSKTVKNTSVKFNCVYNNKFKKWLPLTPC